MQDEDIFPSRPLRRYLRRVFNGRTVPILIAGAPVLTYKEAIKLLGAMDETAREEAVAQIKQSAG